MRNWPQSPSDYLDQKHINQVSRKKTRVEIGEEILTQRISLEEAAQQNPQILFGCSKLKMDLANYLKDQDEKKPPQKELLPFLPNPWGKTLPAGIKSIFINIRILKKSFFKDFDFVKNVMLVFLFINLTIFIRTICANYFEKDSITMTSDSPSF